MILIETKHDAIVVHIRCEVDLAEKNEFYEALLLAREGNSKRLVVSLLDCGYMDCSGLSGLVTIRNAVPAPMSVVVPEGSFLQRLFFTAGLAVRLNVVTNIDAASVSRPGTSHSREMNVDVQTPAHERLTVPVASASE